MTEGKCWDNKENRILNIKKENENKKEILLIILFSWDFSFNRAHYPETYKMLS